MAHSVAVKVIGAFTRRAAITLWPAIITEEFGDHVSEFGEKSHVQS